MGSQISQTRTIQVDVTLIGLNDARHNLKQRGAPTVGLAQQHHKLACINPERKIVKNLSL